MSIFESKPQIIRRRLREVVGGFFSGLGSWFQGLRRGTKIAVYIGGSVIAVSLVFLVIFLAMQQPPEPEPEGPHGESVAEAIDRISNVAQGPVTTEMAPEIIEDINEQIERSEDGSEISMLYILKFKVLFNAALYHEAVAAGAEAIERNVIEEDERLSIYAMMVSGYGIIGNREERRRFAQLIVDRYENGEFDDMGGSMHYYIAIANGDI